MTYLKLDNYIKTGSASADNLKFVRVDSTQAIKKDATFTRKVSAFDPKSQMFSVPEYRAIFRNDVPADSGLPSGQRLSVDLQIRLPVAATKPQLVELLTSLRTLLAESEFDDAVIQQLFPCEGPCLEG